jgi:hypothetical protein
VTTDPVPDNADGVLLYYNNSVPKQHSKFVPLAIYKRVGKITDKTSLTI